jgi:hypothetical protein
MPRKHTFLITVLLGAVFLAGIVAVSRTVLLGQPANASTASDPAIAFRMRKLDRLETSLERRMATMQPAKHPKQITIYRHAPAAAATRTSFEEGEHEGSFDD